MRRLILSAVLLALVVGCGPTGPTNQAGAPAGAYGSQQRPKPTDGSADGPKKDTAPKKEDGK